MSHNNVFAIKKPEPFIDDPITDIIRNGARKLLAEALEAEIESFMAQYRNLKDDPGRQRITHNGYLPERQIQRAIGSVPAKVPRIRDRRRTSNQTRFGSGQPFCLPICARPKVWKN